MIHYLWTLNVFVTQNINNLHSVFGFTIFSHVHTINDVQPQPDLACHQGHWSKSRSSNASSRSSKSSSSSINRFSLIGTAVAPSLPPSRSVKWIDIFTELTNINQTYSMCLECLMSKHHIKYKHITILSFMHKPTNAHFMMMISCICLCS